MVSTCLLPIQQGSTRKQANTPSCTHCCAPGNIPQLAALEQGTDTINQMCLHASKWPNSQATAAGLSTAGAAAAAADAKWRAARQHSRAAETGHCFGPVDLCFTTGSGEKRLPIEGFGVLQFACTPAAGIGPLVSLSTPACCAATKHVVKTSPLDLKSSNEHNQA